MYQANLNQYSEITQKMNPVWEVPVTSEVQPDSNVEQLLADLSPDVSWGNRQMAARKLGTLGCPEAVPGLLEVLPADPFWMVRCAIVQALEMIGDPDAIPTLRDVAETDGFKVVRSYAAKAVERLSGS
jgi:HEAT repeat protein